jgi:hypothetical protein
MIEADTLPGYIQDFRAGFAEVERYRRDGADPRREFDQPVEFVRGSWTTRDMLFVLREKSRAPRH